MTRNIGDLPACTSLGELPAGTRATLCDHSGAHALPARLADLGLVPGTPLSVLRAAPFGGPIEIELRGYRMVLRRSDITAVCAFPEATKPESADPERALR